MSSKQKIFIIIGAIAIIAISFVAGLFIGQKNAPKNDLAFSKVYSQTFYAKIESIKQYNDGSFHLNVRGLEVNDINYRGDFTFEVDDSMNMTWRGEKVKVLSGKGVGRADLRGVRRGGYRRGRRGYDPGRRTQSLRGDGSGVWPLPHVCLRSRLRPGEAAAWRADPGGVQISAYRQGLLL